MESILGLTSLLARIYKYATPVTPLTEEDARKFINESSEEFFNFFDTLTRSIFEDDDSKNFVEVLQRLNLLENTANKLTLMAKTAENYPYEHFKDEKVKLGMRNIRMSSYLYILGEEYFKKLLISTTYLKELGTDSDISKFKNQDECELAYMPDIYKIISTSDDEAELKYYWEAWRDHNNKFGSEHLQIFIDLFKKAATLTDTKPLNLWYRIYMDSDFLAEMEKVMEQIEPFYKNIHSYIRYDLNKKYGDEIVPKDGPIPYHLFDKVLVQNWIKHVVEPPYPDYQLPDFDTRIKEMVEKANKKTLLHIVDEFYESMGIEDPDKALLEDDDDDDVLVENLNEKKSESSDCKAQIYAQSTYYYLQICPQITFRKFLQTHGWAIPISFVQQKKSLPYANFQSYNFDGPSGEAVILSASSPKHLLAIGLLTDNENDNIKLPMNRLFKMSVHTMLNIPMYFVHSKVMNDLLSGEVTIENVNEYYWKLMKQYAGVVPPMERCKDSFDFPYKFYENLENNHQTTKFVSEIAGYQIYSSICKKSEIDQSSLHNCDFYKSKKAGDILKEFMKIGSTKPWRESLSVITGDESGLNGNAILEYYEPISVWLNTNIKDKNIPVGW